MINTATYKPNDAPATPYDGLKKLKEIIDLGKKGLLDTDGLSDDREEAIRQSRILGGEYKPKPKKD